MIRRYIPGALITLALAIVTIWIARHTYWEEIETPVWPKGDAATNTFYAAEHLAQLLGARAQRRHEIAALPPQNAIIVASEWNWNLIPSRSERLEQWVGSGGRLVLDHGLVGDEQEVERWTGVSRVEIVPEKKEKKTKKNDQIFVCPPGTVCRPVIGDSARPSRCPDFDIEAGSTPTGTSRTQYSLCNFDVTSRLVSARKHSWALRDDHARIQAVRVPIGRGSVTLINGWPFGNRELLSGDQALLFATATQLRRGDEIYFLSDDRGPALLGLMWTYGAPVIVLALVLLALSLWRSGVKFGPLAAVPDSARRSLGEQIRGTGQFTMRFGAGRALHAATSRALRETAERHITHYARLSAEERIEALARATGANSGELAEALNFTGPRRPGELRRTIALLESARRAILVTNTNRSLREGS